MTYSELKAHIVAHTDRADLGDVVDTFIAQAVSEINMDVRCGAMVVRATSSISTQFTNLPSDCLEVFNVQNNDRYGEPILNVSVNEADIVKQEWMGVTDAPKYYTVVRDSIELVPAPNTSYSIGITYFQKVTTPSSADTTSTMMDSYPQLFILGSLKYAYDYLKEKDEYVDKSQKFDVEKAKINKSFKTSSFGDGALHVRRRTYG